ncbi:MAG: hypothetical protein ACOZDY_18145 [Pseudomonadota bacterium]
MAYPGRAPHIHFAVTGAGIAPLVTQMYVAGAPENERDFLLSRVGDEKARQSLIVALDTRTADDERVGRFDIVVARRG